VIFLIGFIVGGFFGITLMSIFAIGKREDALMDCMYEKIDQL